MCREVTSSHGYWSNLKGYWRFDEGSGQTAYDQTLNNNDGTLGSTTGSDTNDPSWATSGAAIGDASANDYSSPFSVNLAHSDGDDITIDNLSGSPSGVQVYRVNSAPNVTTVPSGSGWDKLDPLRYWGVFIIGGSSPTYTVTYDYGGHPGIQMEANLRLAKRDNDADGTWEDTGMIPSGGKLTKTGESGTEYILGTTSSDNSLPVELTSFTAEQEKRDVVLEWTTESEIENLRFILERRILNIEQGMSNDEVWKEITSYLTDDNLKGYGSTSQKNEYKYTDKAVIPGMTYEYRLSNGSYNGIVKKHGTCKILVKTVEESTIPEKFGLTSVYPNPFNPMTHIAFSLHNESEVSVMIMDLLGREVRQLVNERRPSGNYTETWDGTNYAGIESPSGIYFIVMRANGFLSSHKVILFR